MAESPLGLNGVESAEIPPPVGFAQPVQLALAVFLGLLPGAGPAWAAAQVPLLFAALGYAACSSRAPVVELFPPLLACYAVALAAWLALEDDGVAQLPPKLMPLQFLSSTPPEGASLAAASFACCAVCLALTPTLRSITRGSGASAVLYLWVWCVVGGAAVDWMSSLPKVVGGQAMLSLPVRLQIPAFACGTMAAYWRRPSRLEQACGLAAALCLAALPLALPLPAEVLQSMYHGSALPLQLAIVWAVVPLLSFGGEEVLRAGDREGPGCGRLQLSFSGLLVAPLAACAPPGLAGSAACLGACAVAHAAELAARLGAERCGAVRRPGAEEGEGLLDRQPAGGKAFLGAWVGEDTRPATVAIRIHPAPVPPGVQHGHVLRGGARGREGHGAPVRLRRLRDRECGRAGPGHADVPGRRGAADPERLRAAAVAGHAPAACLAGERLDGGDAGAWRVARADLPLLHAGEQPVAREAEREARARGAHRQRPQRGLLAPRGRHRCRDGARERPAWSSRPRDGGARGVPVPPRREVQGPCDALGRAALQAAPAPQRLDRAPGRGDALRRARSVCDIQLHCLDENVRVKEHGKRGEVVFPDCGQGVILYNTNGVPLEAHLTAMADVARVADDLGKFRLCSESLQFPAIGMHGSFAIINQAVETAIGFDHGEAASITEDSYFACVANAELRVGIRWIDAFMFEQSPFGPLDLIHQRARWFHGMSYCTFFFDNNLPIRTNFIITCFMMCWSCQFLIMSVRVVYQLGCGDQGVLGLLVRDFVAEVFCVNYLLGFLICFSPYREGVGRWLCLLFMNVSMLLPISLIELTGVLRGMYLVATNANEFYIVQKESARQSGPSDELEDDLESTTASDHSLQSVNDIKIIQ
ncbi:unnamed protein product [Prorocentrum cordatum]|uniref:Glycosyltransferase 2-like domain-containing protein n=1 Tax=Prorocentrum cordatum TaxID=2364126 RepID=A0ABN9QLR3_9DINO|nr:unnamed protein product [Polarella glacialis]